MRTAITVAVVAATMGMVTSPTALRVATMGGLAVAHVAVDVLHDHDAVVHQAAEGEDQGEEHHDVQRHAEGVQHDEAR